LTVTEFLEWLLDLENIRLGHDAPLLVKWGAHVPGWALFCLALAGLTWITLVYRRERAPLGRRVALAALRAVIVALVVAVLCEPSLVLEQNRVEPSHVVLLVDTSQSMAAREPYQNETLAGAITRGAGFDDVSRLAEHGRLDLVKAALTRNEATPLATVLERNGIQLCTFSGAVETQGFAASEETLPAVVERLRTLQADGRTTDIAGALSRTIENAQGRRLAAIILATDGQTTEPTSLKDALDLARGRQIPVLPLRFGSTERPRDVDVGPVRAEESVFVNDIASVEAQITASGLSESTPINIRLVDDRSGTTLTSLQATLDPAESTRTIELHWKPSQTGRFRYRIQAEPLPNERTTANNTAHVDMTVLDDQLHVLYVESYPRYEYRYLKNALLREETMELSVLLIEADKRFVQEGTDPIRRFPETPEELNRYDVVLFGDVDPRGGWLSEAQMKMLLDFVGNEGGGFGLVAGERFAPHRFLGTPLEKLIPVRIDPNFLGHYDTPLATGFRPIPTPEGRRSRLFRFGDQETNVGDDAAESDGGLGSLPELYWLARTLGPKPGASVLAEHPTMRALTGPMPVVVVGRYGAGKIFFQATDDTWRWRRHTGELLHDTYWVQVARELMRSGRVSQDRRFVLRTDRRAYTYGSPIQTQVDVFDTRLLALHPDTIGIVVSEEVEGPEESRAGDLGRDSVRSVMARFDVNRISPSSGLFEGTYVAPHAGTFALKTEDILPRPGESSRAGTSVFVRVEQPDVEARRQEANHEVLERIAGSTGGRVIELDQLETEFGAIRDRSVQIPDDITEPLWDSKLVLALFALMISMEWTLRKVFGLL
jgi:hypothetical protein